MFSFSPLLLAAALTATGDLQLLEFTATWCGPCQAMQPVVEQLQAQGYTVRPIDIDQHRELASQFQVTRVPTFILVAGREPVGRLEGAASAEQLLALFRQHANRPAAPVAAAPRRIGRADPSHGPSGGGCRSSQRGGATGDAGLGASPCRRSRWPVLRLGHDCGRARPGGTDPDVRTPVPRFGRTRTHCGRPVCGRRGAVGYGRADSVRALSRTWPW